MLVCYVGKLSPNCVLISFPLTVLCIDVFQAYTSQFISLVMFGLMMCDDRISMQERRKEIIQGLKILPGRNHERFTIGISHFLQKVNLYFRNDDFWIVQGIMNTSCLLQSK